MSAAANNEGEASSLPPMTRARVIARALEQLPDELQRLSAAQKETSERTDRLEEHFETISEQFIELRQRFTALEHRFTDIQERFTPLQLALEQLQRDLAYLPHQASELERLRPDLAEVRRQLGARLEAELEATELVGRLLRTHEARLEALEGRGGTGAPPPSA